MADGINIRILPNATEIKPNDILVLDNPLIGTQTVPVSSLANFISLSGSTTTLLSGGISPSGVIIPNKLGLLYFSANTKDYFISVGTVDNKDWKRILTVGY
jgi:hypothetical protein